MEERYVSFQQSMIHPGFLEKRHGSEMPFILYCYGKTLTKKHIEEERVYLDYTSILYPIK